MEINDEVLSDPSTCPHGNEYMAHHKVICSDCLLVLRDNTPGSGYYFLYPPPKTRSTLIVRQFANDWPKEYMLKVVDLVRKHHSAKGRDNKTLIFFCKKFIAEKYDLPFPVRENLDKIGISWPSKRSEKKYMGVLTN